MSTIYIKIRLQKKDHLKVKAIKFDNYNMCIRICSFTFGSANNFNKGIADALKHLNLFGGWLEPTPDLHI